MSNQLQKYSTKLNEFYIEYVPSISIKGQVFLDFLDKIPYEELYSEEKGKWKLHIDGSFNKNGNGAGHILVTLEVDPYNVH